MKVTSLSDLRNLAEDGRKRIWGPERRVIIGYATCGISAGAEEIYNKVEEKLAEQEIEAKVRRVGCIGLCYLEPLLDIQLDNHARVTYGNVEPEMIPQIIEEHIGKNEPVKKRAVAQLYRDPSALDLDFPKLSAYEDIPSYDDLEFLSNQKRIAMRNCGIIDPESLEEYVARGGYTSAYNALHNMSRNEVLQEVKESNLRGRGGAGFPTGLKWSFAKKNEADQKYIICNADEGDPGAYMDRAVLEGDPHAIIEGMIIGSYVIGATKAFIYVRAEYPLAIERLEKAIAAAYEYGILGKNVMESNHSLDVRIVRGAGAFVCGEETAMMHSIEGKRGTPRPRPPFPAEKGVHDKPTNINNVETWANIPVVVSKGGEWFSSIGTKKSGGTKVFSLVGKVKRTGLTEVPFGTRLGEIIYDVGGGIKEDKNFKAAQTGGPSGGCIPTDHLNTEVDYEALDELGSIMGSGGMVVLDEDDCPVDIAKYFLGFTFDESCGQCTPCRYGIKKMLEILERVSVGDAEEKELDQLEEIAKTVKEASLCGLGQTAPNPVLTVLSYFKDELLNHITDLRCPAGVCSELAPASCRSACPAEVNVPVYVSHIAEREYEEALTIHREANPFPSICGRVCPAFCEKKCRRAWFDEPVSIRTLKRFMASHVKQKWEPAKEKRDRGVAIVGGGPAGLTASLRLAQKGYDVTIFEAREELGGMMRWGIPDHRLPKDVLKQEIEPITEHENIEVKTNTKIGEDVPFDSLIEEYDAVLITVGANKGVTINIPGIDSEGVISGLDFLTSLNSGEDVNYIEGKKVAIIGGGNVAIDSARSSLRLGAEEVKIVYRRRRIDMPANVEEVGAAEEEGAEFRFLYIPNRIIEEDDKVAGLECLKSKLKDEKGQTVIDSSGRKTPFPEEGTETMIDADIVILALGQRPDLSFLDESKLEIKTDGTLEIDERTLATSEDGVFGAGDTVYGPASIVEAVSHGNYAAKTIERYLEGEEDIVHPAMKMRRPEEGVGEFEIAEKDFERPRQEQEYLPLDERRNNFREVQLGFPDEETAKAEARRCLRCDLQPAEE